MLPRKTVIWLVSIRLPVRLFPLESRNSQRCSVSFRTQMVNQRGLTFRDSAKAIRNLNEQQKTGIAAAKALAAAGLHVEVYASTEAERKAGKPNGIYRKADGSIAIDLNAGDNGQGAVAYALAHETTHFIQDYSPAKFETYAELIIAAAESKGISYDSLLARQLARLSEMEEYKNLSETELQDIAYDETIAEMSETILTDTDAAKRLSQQIYKQDRTLWQKIKDFFTGLVEKLRNAYKDSDPDSDIGRMLKRAVQDNAEIAQAWAEAVREAGENYQLQDGQKNNAREGERYSDRASKYSYEYFTEKADMPVTAVDEMQNRDRESIIQAALRNAKEVGRTNENGNALVYVNDIGRNVLVGKKALAHGLDRRASTQAPVLAKIGDVLKNAVKVNELNPRSESIKESYVLVGAARSEMGLYVASFVVNQHSNEITSIDVLYAANAKKEPAALLPKITEESATPTGSKISIAKLLDIVNELYPDILPEEVLKHYGHTKRPAGKIGESALYSSRNSGESRVDRLVRKNEEMKAEAEYLKQVVQIQKQGNRKNLRDRESVNAIAKDILESVNAKDGEFGKKLNDFYRDLVTVEMDYDTMQEKAGELADRALEHHQAERDGYAQDILDFLKKRRVSLTESQIGDAEYTYGSLSEFKKAIRGSIILDQNSTTSLDQLWQEAAARFPDRFVADTTEADMPDGIANIVSWANSAEADSETEFQYYKAETKADLTRKGD